MLDYVSAPISDVLFAINDDSVEMVRRILEFRNVVRRFNGRYGRSSTSEKTLRLEQLVSAFAEVWPAQ